MSLRHPFLGVATLLLTSSLSGPAQTIPAAPKIDDCTRDSRPSVATFCHYLSDFQAKVNNGVKEGDSSLVNDLNNLDLSMPQASVNFITAAADQLATSTAEQNAGNQFLGWLNQQRPDQQLGASASATGTTSLVSKSGSSDLISLAIDAGALTQTVNGTTATLGTNADELFRVVTNHNPDCLEYVNCSSLGWFDDSVLDKLSLSAGLSLAQQSSTTTSTSGQASGSTSTAVGSVQIPSGAGRLSNISAKYAVRNKFDPKQATFQSKWMDAIKNNGPLKTALQAQGTDTDLVRASLQKNAPALDQDDLYQAAASDKTGKELYLFFDSYYSTALSKAQSDSGLANKVAAVEKDRVTYRGLWEDMLTDAVGTMFSVQYTFNQPLNQPKTHDVTAVYAYAFKTMGTITANGGLSLYNGTLPPKAAYGRVHFGQVSAEYDQNLSSTKSTLQEQLSLAGYWQYQPQPSVLNIPAGTVAPGTSIPLPNGTQEFVGSAGSLWVTQARLTIKGTGGINLPVGVSWSNKTDLLEGSKVGAQIGISYDLSSLSNLL
jgi:hypothetical protein